MYRERAPYSPLMKLGFLLLLVIFAFMWTRVGIGVPMSGLIILAIGSAVMVLFFRFFFNIEFAVTNDAIEARFGDYNYRIPVKNIKSIRVIHSVPFYVGWGLRMYKGKVAFVSEHSRGVYIELKSGPFKEVVLTTRDPAEFVQRIKKLQGRSKRA